MSQNQSKPVLFEEIPVSGGCVARITLNQPQRLNALSLQMYQLILEKLQHWEKRSDILWLWVDSSCARSFSAGGDVKQLALDLFAGDLKQAREFFTTEYLVDYKMHKYNKPIVVFGQGYIFGGGWGLYQSCAYRIAAESAVFSMPEISIGLFPDVGASCYFSHLTEETALFLGLTGARLNAREALELGFAQALVDSQDKDRLLESLLHVDWRQAVPREQKMQRIQGVVSSFFSESLMSKDFLGQRFEAIKLLELGAGFEKMHQSFKLHRKNPHLKKDLERYFAGPELSQRVIYKLLKDYRTANIKDALLRDWHLALKMCRADSFREGVRALLIDRDNKPLWPPWDKEIDDVESYFLQNEGEDLQLLMDLGVSAGQNIE